MDAHYISTWRKTVAQNKEKKLPAGRNQVIVSQGGREECEEVHDCALC